MAHTITTRQQADHENFPELGHLSNAELTALFEERISQDPELVLLLSEEENKILVDSQLVEHTSQP